MAFQELREQFTNATIDCADGTLTEFQKDKVSTYSIEEILKRWNGISNITLIIERRMDLPLIEER